MMTFALLLRALGMLPASVILMQLGSLCETDPDRELVRTGPKLPAMLEKHGSALSGLANISMRATYGGPSGASAVQIDFPAGELELALLQGQGHWKSPMQKKR